MSAQQPLDDITWHRDVPDGPRPLLLAAFEGWNDAGDAASTALRRLADHWDAEPLATIDADPYFNFSVIRPRVHLDEDDRRQVSWPKTQVLYGTDPNSEQRAIFVTGHEPHLRWRRFCHHITEIARQTDCRLAFTIGALLADVAHSRPTPVFVSAECEELQDRFEIQGSDYEGPTGIVGALKWHLIEGELPTLSLWAPVPSYVPNATSPKATMALIERFGELTDTTTVVTDLEIASASYERQVSELVAEDEATLAYVEDLEREWDELEAADALEMDPEVLFAEVEEFLRDND